MDIIKAGAYQSVYEKCKKRIENQDTKDSAELDEMVDQVVNGIWSEQGLLCDNPEQRIKEVTSLGELWWPIYGIIDTLRILREYNRLE